MIIGVYIVDKTTRVPFQHDIYVKDECIVLKSRWMLEWLLVACYVWTSIVADCTSVYYEAQRVILISV